MQKIGLAVVLATLAPTGASAQAPQPGAAAPSASDATTHDFGCVVMAMDAGNAIQSAPASDGHDQDRMQTVMRRINYYLGKIDARDSSFDFTAAFKRYEAVDRPRFSQDHQALRSFFDACVAEQSQSWSAFAGSVTKADQK